MAISHKDHDHPNTPAARAACRKAMGKVIEHGPADARGSGTWVKPAQLNVVPRKRGDGGVVRGMQATAPKVAVRRLKTPGQLIRHEHDLADVPRDLAAAVRDAWGRDWDVQSGHPFNEMERRIIISGEVGTAALVWADGDRVGFFVRSFDSSVTRAVTSWKIALDLISDADKWPWRNADGMCI